MIRSEIVKDGVSYPKLMYAGQVVVLFSEAKVGVCISNDLSFGMGCYSTDWNMSEFSHFTGVVKLSNGG